MAAAHNAFIQGINAMVAHAPNITSDKVEPFMVFSLAVVDSIHHHHDMEETFYFPEIEKKLGAGSMSASVDQHHTFVPQLVQLKEWIESVRAGTEMYDGKLLVEKVHSFSDIMINHLNEEIPSLESSRMRAVFTEKELKDIDNEFMKQALAKIDFNTTLPLSIVCGNPATPWFPPFPLPLKWATRWWFSRKYPGAWEFGPLDLAGNPRAAL
ncbi:hypothetical protein FB45DRAFT_299503 [Roridomyces roridus]|uniref:Hemerythrin-like domain-containing protein n=1 Tax=Roridomyces roridus TaxID=1738132 RepID=A0AAD7CCR3_9AGAR|nr:hypothetical protein FB45DRAFT_299503 [Roridomyces roridus]